MGYETETLKYFNKNQQQPDRIFYFDYLLGRSFSKILLFKVLKLEELLNALSEYSGIAMHYHTYMAKQNRSAFSPLVLMVEKFELLETRPVGL